MEKKISSRPPISTSKLQEAPQSTPTGYLSPSYGQSFRSVGEIVTLPKSGLQLIRRNIRPGAFDLIGLYPYSMCRDFTALTETEDQAALRATGAIALSFVADPFETETVQESLKNWQVCRRFKTHFVIDLASDWRRARTKNTRYYVRKGYNLQTAEIAAGNRDLASPFWTLYQDLIHRLGITGIQRMSQEIIADQLQVPGIFVTLARERSELVGAMMSFVHDTHANVHLICFGKQRSTLYQSIY